MFPEDAEQLNPAIILTNEKRIEECKENQRSKNELIKIADNIQKLQFASCWFVGARESYAMWNIYSTADSVVIRIKLSDLLANIERSILNYSDETFVDEIICGPVHYQKVYPPEYDGNLYENSTNKYTALKKDLSYKYEKEYRIVALAKSINEKNMNFELYLDQLHETEFKIITHPKMQQWMYNNITNILLPYNLNSKLMKSTIKLKPST